MFEKSAFIGLPFVIEAFVEHFDHILGVEIVQDIRLLLALVIQIGLPFVVRLKEIDSLLIEPNALLGLNTACLFRLPNKLRCAGKPTD
mmetsp:Transcript_24500/g.32834  ORF Transcript_24500/g.32834 Transcript_24500/m.32834 type:complete len:88 (+) Transcript_24500:618-881(+)